MANKVSDEIKDQYLRVSFKLDLETSHLSFVPTDHPSFVKIVKMGKETITLMLNEIKRNSNCNVHWRFLAICEITKKEGIELVVIPEESAGCVEEMRHLYLAWGQKHGFMSI
ncbi:MAG: hypothetical protein M1429_01065 [Patescibacteria group bacterium]|nr:hypothetical protein [Patescibacteria group bacterium]